MSEEVVSSEVELVGFVSEWSRVSSVSSWHMECVRGMSSRLRESEFVHLSRE